MTAHPKPERPLRGTAECREYLADVAQLSCVCCGAHPVVVHHTIMGRHAQRKSSDLDTIPLCPSHHDQIHKSPGLWRAFYGFDTEYIPATRRAVEKLRKQRL